VQVRAPHDREDRCRGKPVEIDTGAGLVPFAKHPQSLEICQSRQISDMIHL
jgi:hypothetical protein